MNYDYKPRICTKSNETSTATTTPHLDDFYRGLVKIKVSPATERALLIIARELVTLGK